MTAVIIIMSVMLLSMSVWADSNHAGAFLRMGAGARAAGMGGAFTGVADDATAGYWNPAGLTQVERIEVVGMYTSGLTADMTSNYLAYAQAFKFGSVGISWINSGMGDVQLADSEGNQTGEDDYSSNAFLFSYGKGFNKFNFGMNVKVLMHDVPDADSESGFGVDFGLMYQPSDFIHLGVMAQDLASKLGEDTVPANFRLGVGVHPANGLTVAADIEKTHDDDGATVHFGAEYKLVPMDNSELAARAGMDGNAFAAGLGFAFSIVQFDYAYVAEDEDGLEDNHKFSLGVKF